MAVIAIARTSDDLALARELFREYADTEKLDLCFQGFDDELATLPGRYAGPSGALLLARDSAGQPAGCVAMRSLGIGTCEMKRLFVRPSHRGRGLGRELTVAILQAARVAGHRRMVLDTLAHMRGAIALYRSLGFEDIAPYTPNPLEGATYLGLELSPEGPPGA